MKQVVTDPAQLPTIATVGWCSSASCGLYERTMFPVEDHGECQRMYGPDGSLVYFEDDHIVYKADIEPLMQKQWANTKAQLERVGAN
jgi:hypothetical protein